MRCPRSAERFARSLAAAKHEDPHELSEPSRPVAQGGQDRSATKIHRPCAEADLWAHSSPSFSSCRYSEQMRGCVVAGLFEGMIMDAKKYDEFAATLIELVGGRDNIDLVLHCIVRVRFILKDENLADTEAIENTEGVLKVVQANGQYQVAVGREAQDIYDAVLRVGDLSAGGEVPADEEDYRAMAEENAKKRGVFGSLKYKLSGFRS